MRRTPTPGRALIEATHRHIGTTIRRLTILLRECLQEGDATLAYLKSAAPLLHTNAAPSGRGDRTSLVAPPGRVTPIP